MPTVDQWIERIECGANRRRQQRRQGRAAASQRAAVRAAAAAARAAWQRGWHTRHASMSGGGGKARSRSRSRSRAAGRATPAARSPAQSPAPAQRPRRQHPTTPTPAVHPPAAAPPPTTTTAEPQLSVIVPTYCEAENVPILLWLLREAMAPTGVPWEAVFVDDASPDGTAAAIEAARDALCGGSSGSSIDNDGQQQQTPPRRRGRQQQQQPQQPPPSTQAAAAEAGAPLRVALVRRPGKLGLGTAYAAGLKAARAPWVVLMDADLSHHPRHVPEMLRLQAATGADVVASTRYAPGGGVSGWSFRRKLTSRGANVLAATLLGLSAPSDLTGSYRLYRRPVLEALLRRVRSKGYAFQMEMMAVAAAGGASVAELPIVFVDRVFGASKLGSGEYAAFAAGLLRLLLTL